MTAEPCPNCGTDVEESQESHAGVVFDVLKCPKCKWKVSKAVVDSDGNTILWDC